MSLPIAPANVLSRPRPLRLLLLLRTSILPMPHCPTNPASRPNLLYHPHPSPSAEQTPLCVPQLHGTIAFCLAKLLAQPSEVSSSTSFKISHQDVGRTPTHKSLEKKPDISTTKGKLPSSTPAHLQIPTPQNRRANCSSPQHHRFNILRQKLSA